MVIRPARPEDALRIATIHVEAWRVAYRGIVPDEVLCALSIEQRHVLWRQNLEGKEPFTQVAEDGDTALGWVSAARSRDMDADARQSTGEIWAVYVDPGHWSKGVGRALCAAAEQRLRTEVAAVTLWVLKDNERALRFYESNGFVRDADADKVVTRGGKELSEVRMRKRLIDDVTAGPKAGAVS
jgi:ribosomal protein S18 acetylase RimI-like enzyme